MPNVHGWYGDMELNQMEHDLLNGDTIDPAAVLQFLREARNCRSGGCIDDREDHY